MKALATLAASAILVASSAAEAAPPKRPPNVVIVLADDLGYGDLGAYGAQLIRTPNLDRLAKGGVRMTNFYSAANVCTPSRAGLLTGRYPIRMGLAHEVIRSTDTHGLPLNEVTIAEALGPQYRSAVVGKWHLGHKAPFWPPAVQGFEDWYALPYSHDMRPLALYRAETGPDAGEKVDLQKLTEQFFARGAEFIEANKARPFFLYLALTAPHVPLDPNPPFKSSRAGAYGDVVEEVDAGIGRLSAQLKRLGLERDTIVIVTSDNGPWFEGSTGNLRERKGGSGWEGGFRVPLIASQPGTIPAGKVRDGIAMNIDLLPTILSLVGARPVESPAGALDGRDLSAVWRAGAASPHDELVLFNNERVAGIRTQDWKLVGRSYYRRIDVPLGNLGVWLLFDLKNDPGETYNVADRHPEVLKAMKARFERAVKTFEPMGVRQQADNLPAT